MMVICLDKKGLLLLIAEEGFIMKFRFNLVSWLKRGIKTGFFKGFTLSLTGDGWQNNYISGCKVYKFVNF